MGQQQLLLIVLGIVIVGLAVVAGIQAFATNQKKANVDALVLSSTTIASNAQAWLKTPVTMGGGLPVSGVVGDFSALTSLEFLGYSVNGGGDYQDLHGTYSIDVSTGDLVITASSAAASGAGDNNLVCTTVSGAQLSDIVTVINPSIGSC